MPVCVCFWKLPMRFEKDRRASCTKASCREIGWSGLEANTTARSRLVAQAPSTPVANTMQCALGLYIDVWVPVSLDTQ
jgi:hypothetical protein